MEGVPFNWCYDGQSFGGPKFTPVAYIIAMENTIFGDLLEFLLSNHICDIRYDFRIKTMFD
jgi:hypothetical protein